MENKDTNTDYQKVVRAGDQKWEIAETTFGIIFLFEIRRGDANYGDTWHMNVSNNKLYWAGTRSKPPV